MLFGGLNALWPLISGIVHPRGHPRTPQGHQNQPDLAEHHNNLGAALCRKGLLNKAMAAYRQAIKLKKDCLEAHNNLGNALQDAGRLDNYVRAFE